MENILCYDARTFPVGWMTRTLLALRISRVNNLTIVAIVSLATRVRLMKAAHQDWCAQTQKAFQLG